MAALFRNRISSGAWPVGARIPTLEQLTAECGVARATVRQALGELEQESLIIRERAKGTLVLRQPTQQHWCALQLDWPGMLASRDGARIELLQRTDGLTLPDQDRPIGVACDGYVRLQRRHWFDDRPFLLTSVYIAHHLMHAIPEDRLVRQTAIRMVAEIPGIVLTNAHQVFTAGAADMVEADRLMLPLNAPVMRLDRYATGADDALLVVSLGIYRADAVRLDVGLSRTAFNGG